MISQPFTWVDLSTFDLKQTKEFYHQIFSWDFFDEKDTNGEDYAIAYQEETALAGIYNMPTKFQQMNLPSFWMGYIRVQNLDQVVKKAKTHQGAIVEIEPTPFQENSQIALIRDPSGAGFTAYEGPELNSRNPLPYQGHNIWNLLHISDIDLVKNFYTDVFNWQIIPSATTNNRYLIKSQSNQIIAHIDILPEKIKGKYQYWMPVFTVHNLPTTEKLITTLRGKITLQVELNQVMCQDPQGGSFIITDNFKLPQ